LGPVLDERFPNPLVQGRVRARHQGVWGKEGRDFGDQVTIYHRHLGQAAGESDRPVVHCVYREVVPDRGRGVGGLLAQGEVDRRKALGMGS